MEVDSFYYRSEPFDRVGHISGVRPRPVSDGKGFLLTSYETIFNERDLLLQSWM